MNMRFIITSPVLFALVLFSSASSLLIASQDERPADRSLRGIETMQVLVEGLPEDAGKLGVHKDTLQTDVELRIRQNGIKVTDNLKDTQAIIYVNVSVVDNAAAIEVSIEQQAQLLRNNSIRSLATTWNTGGLIVKVRGEKDVREYLLDLVDKFINAWLSVNPRSR